MIRCYCGDPAAFVFVVHGVASSGTCGYRRCIGDYEPGVDPKALREWQARHGAASLREKLFGSLESERTYHAVPAGGLEHAEK
jgi:hypothetical protein